DDLAVGSEVAVRARLDRQALQRALIDRAAAQVTRRRRESEHGLACLALFYRAIQCRGGESAGDADNQQNDDELDESKTAEMFVSFPPHDDSQLVTSLL